MSTHLLARELRMNKLILTYANYACETLAEFTQAYGKNSWFKHYEYLALIPSKELPEWARSILGSTDYDVELEEHLTAGGFNRWLFDKPTSYCPPEFGAKPRTWAHGEVWATSPVDASAAWNATLIAAGDPRAVRKEI